jgi:excisionase family DNA binding protein
MSTSTLAPRWLKRTDAAKTYGISLDTLDRLRGSGEVRTKRNGRSVLVEVASLDEWVEQLEDG